MKKPYTKNKKKTKSDKWTASGVGLPRAVKGIVVETVREDVGPTETLFAMPKDPRAIHVSGDQQILHTPEIRVRVTVELFGREADNIRPGDAVNVEEAK